MMNRHFSLNSELSGAIAKGLPHAKNQLSVLGSFFNQIVADIYRYIFPLYIHISTKFDEFLNILYRASNVWHEVFRDIIEF